MDFQTLRHELKTRYPFSGDRYPELRAASTEQLKQFARRHLLLHLTKSLGKLATQVEVVDHGGSDDIAVTEEALVKLVLNALRYAQIEEFPEERLLERIPEFLAKD